jgi:hypothetical protein
MKLPTFIIRTRSGKKTGSKPHKAPRRSPLFLEVLEDRCLLSGFTDSFEGPTFDPFWSTTVQSGSISLSTAQAHTGAQSAQFSSTSTGVNKGLYLFHDFPTPTYGDMSVWIYDTGAGVSSSNYIYFQAYQTDGSSVGIFTEDYGFRGNGPGYGDQYNYQYIHSSGDQLIPTGIERTLAWHQFEIVDTPQAFTLKVDGNTVYNGAGGAPINEVLLSTFGPSYDPAFTAYYDDFSFIPYAPPALSGRPVVNGSSAVTNIVSASGNGTTATIATDGTPHGFWVGELVTLTGVTPGGPGGLAGTVTVTGVPSATTFQFASTYSGSEALNGATATAALAGAQRSMVDSIVYNFTAPVALSAAAFSISAVVDNTNTGDMAGVAPTLNVAPVPFTNEWVVTFTDPVNNSVIGNSIANGAYSITINPSLVTAVSDGQTLSAGETDTFYRLYGDLTGAQSVTGVDVNAFNRAYGNNAYAAGYVAALDYNDGGRYTGIDVNAFNRAFNTRYSLATTI